MAYYLVSILPENAGKNLQRYVDLEVQDNGTWRRVYPGKVGYGYPPNGTWEKLQEARGKFTSFPTILLKDSSGQILARLFNFDLAVRKGNVGTGWEFDPNSTIKWKVVSSSEDQIRNYQIRTLAGGGISAAVGGSVVTFEIQDVERKNSAYYTLTSVDWGAGVHTSAGPSSWTEFSWGCSIDSFYGSVSILQASVAVGAGYGATLMEYSSGPAVGLSIFGYGWLTGAGINVGASAGNMMFRGYA